MNRITSAVETGFLNQANYLARTKLNKTTTGSCITRTPHALHAAFYESKKEDYSQIFPDDAGSLCPLPALQKRWELILKFFFPSYASQSVISQLCSAVFVRFLPHMGNDLQLRPAHSRLYTARDSSARRPISGSLYPRPPPTPTPSSFPLPLVRNKDRLCARDGEGTRMTQLR